MCLLAGKTMVLFTYLFPIETRDCKSPFHFFSCSFVIIFHSNYIPQITAIFIGSYIITLSREHLYQAHYDKAINKMAFHNISKHCSAFLQWRINGSWRFLATYRHYTFTRINIARRKETFGLQMYCYTL